jgi:hypothetical protein
MYFSHNKHDMFDVASKSMTTYMIEFVSKHCLKWLALFYYVVIMSIVLLEFIYFFFSTLLKFG